MTDLIKSDKMNDRKNVKKLNIVEGKGGNNGERIETRRTGVEHKTFLNGDETSKEREDKTRERQSKRKQRLRTEAESYENAPESKKRKEEKQTRTSDAQTPLWHC